MIEFVKEMLKNFVQALIVFLQYLYAEGLFSDEVL